MLASARNALLIGMLLATVGAGPASAASGSGHVALTLGGAKPAKLLATAGVDVHAISPATKRGKRLRLPVRSLAVGQAATVTLGGGIRSGRTGARCRCVHSACD
ncbi:MAG TPA: hypothetical protein VHF88_01365 [Thermoleophilaceae bacterium]|nr:hypothetical protein [Thermoleophilaceae bacterium]